MASSELTNSQLKISSDPAGGSGGHGEICASPIKYGGDIFVRYVSADGSTYSKAGIHIDDDASGKNIGFIGFYNSSAPFLNETAILFPTTGGEFWRVSGDSSKNLIFQLWED